MKIPFSVGASDTNITERENWCHKVYRFSRREFEKHCYQFMILPPLKEDIFEWLGNTVKYKYNEAVKTMPTNFY